MPSPLGPLRAALFVPSPASVRTVMQSFEQSNPHAALELEQVTMNLVGGIDKAVRSSNNAELVAQLAQVPPKYRGFAYEGAAVGLTAIDSLSPGHRAHDLIVGPESKVHDLTMVVGVGLALAKIPKQRWKKLFPQHPLFKWLAVDGYGFYKAFFQKPRYVDRQHVDTRYPRWMGDRANLQRIADNGLGRALWFIGGGTPKAVAERIGGFAEQRHADLWSGVGIAVTFAGGVEPVDMEELWEVAGQYRPQVSLGCAMVTKIRQQTKSSNEHSEAAARVFCGHSVAETDALIDDSLLDLPTDGSSATYLRWRDRIAEIVTASRT
ncbi:DUF1702 family protein [Nocardia sp. NPDC049149]|uniref:DUF1702 family protein n=1 Tax=Nocardia sp. NPDC049149 TaxID=3364315 RepID=UPI003722B550